MPCVGESLVHNRARCRNELLASKGGQEKVVVSTARSGVRDRFWRLVSTLLVLLPLQAAAQDPNNITGSNGLIMIDKRGGLVRFFDPETLREISTLDLAGGPHELAISPDRKTAYVPLYGGGIYGNNSNPGNTIVMIDLESRTIGGTIDVSPHLAPHGLQVDNAGMLYATTELSRTLLIIDPTTQSIEAGRNRLLGRRIA